ncbi:lipid kinase [uncultured Microbulbifer sp.]|uniref:lipid kinase n=1 Tax=uncultured Microbulbifer sp. TaxID=348147 RepID=UPI002629BFD5|nr:lipid kinase [uncultured Microbulbifer sp.]
MTLQCAFSGKNVLLLLNPSSRSGGEGEAEVTRGIEALRRAGCSVEVIETESPDHAERTIREQCDRVDLVALGGGDGTISACAGVLKDCKLPFAVLPLGTANDLARSLGILTLEQAFSAILSGHTATIDLAEINGQYFFNVANLGLGVRVTEALTPELKRRWGVFSYLKAVSEALTHRHQFRVDLDVDGKRHHFRSIQLAVGSGRFYGGGNVIDEAAAINDGLLHMYSVKPQGVMELLTLAPMLRLGQHRVSARVFSASGRKMRIDTRPSAMAVHADGEPVGQTPVTISVCADVLTVVVPEQPAAALQDADEAKADSE